MVVIVIAIARWGYKPTYNVWGLRIVETQMISMCGGIPTPADTRHWRLLSRDGRAVPWRWRMPFKGGPSREGVDP